MIKLQRVLGRTSVPRRDYLHIFLVVTKFEHQP